MARNPLRLDPSRTVTLRRQFILALRKRFHRLASELVELIEKEDAFLLKPLPVYFETVLNVKFAFSTDADKILAFREWLQDRINKGILHTDEGVDPEKPWTSDFIHSAYKKGLIRAFNMARKKDKWRGTQFYEGQKAQFLSDVFLVGEATSKLQLLYTRAYDHLKNITSDMSVKLGQTLAEGLAHGKGPREIAEEIERKVKGISRERAERLARTEIIHAHAEGQLDAFERLGVESVGVQAEWATAGDTSVCPRCAEMEGTIVPVKEAHGLIPLHPNCRCAWIPALD